MAFSNLYSAICRGKWFVSFHEADAHLALVQALMERGIENQDISRLSDREPLLATFCAQGAQAKSGDSFKEAAPGSAAIIPIHGTMLKYGTYCSYGTTEYAEMIREAADASNITSIILDIDSGGGAVNAIAPIVDAISYAKSKAKAVVAHCDLCASAAYYTACHCDEIVASNEISSEFGSIGVMMQLPDYAKYYEMQGIKIHTIYSNLSDYKNAPFEAARKGDYTAIKDEELDPLARDFQAAVQRNRKNLQMNTDGLLRGRMFYARDAVAVGLADSIGALDFAIQRANDINAQATVNNYINSKI